MQIEVGDNYYEPEEITVIVGTTVVWVPIGAHHHTIVSLDARDGWPGDGGVEIIGSRSGRRFTGPARIGITVTCIRAK